MKCYICVNVTRVPSCNGSMALPLAVAIPRRLAGLIEVKKEEAIRSPRRMVDSSGGFKIYSIRSMRDVLSSRVLVLNRLWQAVNIVGARRAFSILVREHAKVIHWEGEDFQVHNFTEWTAFSTAHPNSDGGQSVSTVNLEIRIPRVLLLEEYARLPMKEVKFTRQNLFARDRYTCQYCGNIFPHRSLNLDHVIPRDRGGRTTWENIVTSCLKCNTHKGNRLPHEAGIHLRRKPTRPRCRPFINCVLGNEIIDKSWSTFLSV